jgi:two-component SAPR family response regulator
VRILILEDELLVALELEQELCDLGHEVCLAGTLLQAQTLLAEVDIQFAVLDANIQGQIPKDLAGELLRRTIPFVYVSGYDEAFIRANLPEAPFVPKPIAIEVLTSVIASSTRSPG